VSYDGVCSSKGECTDRARQYENVLVGEHPEGSPCPDGRPEGSMCPDGSA
jgi:hypothetical protein